MTLHILYVEDDAGSRKVLQMADRMNPGEYQLTMYEDSTDFEARILSLAPPPDLILLDIHMLPITGFDMLEIIRHHEQFTETPVVALTASVMNEEVEMLRQAGFHSAMSKPLNLDDFPHLVQQIMNGETLWHIW